MACNNDYWTTKNMTLAYDTLRMSSLYQSIQQDRQPGKNQFLIKPLLNLSTKITGYVIVFMYM